MFVLLDESGEHEMCVHIVEVVISGVAQMRAVHRIEHNYRRCGVSDKQHAYQIKIF